MEHADLQMTDLWKNVIFDRYTKAINSYVRWVGSHLDTGGDLQNSSIFPIAPDAVTRLILNGRLFLGCVPIRQVTARWGYVTLLDVR
jgi:hypothetical protein